VLGKAVNYHLYECAKHTLKDTCHKFHAPKGTREGLKYSPIFDALTT
jgi:hypothetical protein